MSEVFITIVIGFLKAIAYVYDVVAFVPYYMICKPYEKVRLSKRIKVSCVSSNLALIYWMTIYNFFYISRTILDERCMKKFP